MCIRDRSLIEDATPNITPISSVGEFRLIEKLTKDFKCSNKDTVKGVGDDCAVIKSGKRCFGIGKIADIFGHRGISKSISGMPDDKLFDEMLSVIEKANTGDLIFANFVEFDTLYGHRRDVSGYARALESFDKKLPKLFSILDREDFLVITADHGNDPSFAGTDHTREQVPVLIKNHNLINNCYGLINFSDIGSLIENFLGLDAFE